MEPDFKTCPYCNENGYVTKIGVLGRRNRKKLCGACGGRKHILRYYFEIMVKDLEKGQKEHKDINVSFA